MSIIATAEGAASDILSPVISPVSSVVSSVAGSAAGAVLRGISSWVLDGTRGALEQVAGAIGSATAPNLESTWFSSTYWRVAALAAMLTIPFLCAAAVEAVARADLSLLTRVAFGYLPLSILGVSLAAPMTMLLLAATDQMSAIVSASASTGGARFLDHAATVAGALAAGTGGSPFFAVVVGLLALMAAMALAVELLIRAAAVYVVVLMLPLAFAALVWPARRVWAVRLVELLTSLILSKFVIVAVLSLAAAAFTHGTPGIGELLVAMSLLLLSTFSPWALMRILPFTELASGAAGILRSGVPVDEARTAAAGFASGIGEVAMDLPARLRDHARSMYAGNGGPPQPERNASATPGFAEPFDEASTPEAGSFAASTQSAAPAIAGNGAAATGSAAAAAAPSSGPGEPFVVPEPWNRAGPVRLDEHLLRQRKATADRQTPSPAQSKGRDGNEGTE